MRLLSVPLQGLLSSYGSSGITVPPVHNGVMLEMLVRNENSNNGSTDSVCMKCQTYGTDLQLMEHFLCYHFVAVPVITTLMVKSVRGTSISVCFSQ